MPLTDAAIRNAKPTANQFKLADAGGLYLLVKPSGAKLWRLKYRIDGKENAYAIGEYPTTSLTDARSAREEARKLIKLGIHPSHSRQSGKAAQLAENANTFKAVALEWIDQRKPKWAPYYLRQVDRFMAADVFPYIGTMPIRNVTAADLLAIIKRIEKRGAETVAIMVRQWCSAIFRYAVSTLRADTDPAAALKGAIHRPKIEHRKPLERDQIAKFFKAIDEHGGYQTTAIALRLMLLTFVRTVELRAARWEEINLDGAEWRIPAERMKMREAHIVPLSRQVVALLRELHTLTGGGEYLFPNHRTAKTCMSATTLNRALERMGFAGKEGIGFSSHGFRSTASTILNEAGFRPDVIERQLAHAERNKVRASYNRAEYLEERRAMMQQWADMAEQMGAGKVVPIKREAA